MYYDSYQETGLQMLNNFRRLCLVLIFFALVGMSSQVAESQKSNTDYQIDSIQKMQETNDKALAVNQQQLDDVKRRMDKLETEEHESKLALSNKLAGLEAVSNENQMMTRGIVIGVGVLLVVELIKMIGMSFVKRHSGRVG